MIIRNLHQTTRFDKSRHKVSSAAKKKYYVVIFTSWSIYSNFSNEVIFGTKPQQFDHIVKQIFHGAVFFVRIVYEKGLM